MTEINLGPVGARIVAAGPVTAIKHYPTAWGTTSEIQIASPEGLVLWKCSYRIEAEIGEYLAVRATIHRYLPDMVEVFRGTLVEESLALF